MSKYQSPFRKGTLWSKGVPDEWYNSKLTLGLAWKKSLPSYVGLQLIIYIIIWYIINLVYKLVLDGNQKIEFEMVVEFFEERVPPLGRDVTFLLGFYVSLVIKRWWDQFSNLPYPDNLALYNSALVIYESDEARQTSTDIMRYTMLTYVLCLRNLSKVIKREFPTSLELISSGLATEPEMEALEKAGELCTVWWLPLNWAMHRIKVGKNTTKVIPSDHKELMRGINDFYSKLKNLENFTHVPIPPIYTQVAHFAVYVYFALSLIANQELRKHPDIYFPIFLALKFIFFVGWLNVAEAIKNPLGDDYDDFEIGPLISRNIWACGRHLSAGFSGPPPPPAPPRSDEYNDMVTVSVDKDDE